MDLSIESLPLATEKSPLPAIIVTPSSPSSSHDFSIAFMLPPPQPTLKERISTYASSKAFSFPVRARTTFIILVIIFVLVCHVVTHSIVIRRPHLEFSVQTGEAHIPDTSINWFDFRSLIGSTTPDVKDAYAPPLADSSIHQST
ncbi:hypothetical protein C0991_005889 [Blastosporella zonata]|nr:hypothetical protein C0991_005889 [Blastosporella zonata]